MKQYVLMYNKSTRTSIII